MKYEQQVRIRLESASIEFDPVPPLPHITITFPSNNTSHSTSTETLFFQLQSEFEEWRESFQTFISMSCSRLSCLPPISLVVLAPNSLLHSLFHRQQHSATAKHSSLTTNHAIQTALFSSSSVTSSTTSSTPSTSSSFSSPVYLVSHSVSFGDPILVPAFPTSYSLVLQLRDGRLVILSSDFALTAADPAAQHGVKYVSVLSGSKNDGRKSAALIQWRRLTSQQLSIATSTVSAAAAVTAGLVANNNNIASTASPPSSHFSAFMSSSQFSQLSLFSTLHSTEATISTLSFTQPYTPYVNLSICVFLLSFLLRLCFVSADDLYLCLFSLLLTLKLAVDALAATVSSPSSSRTGNSISSVSRSCYYTLRCVSLQHGAAPFHHSATTIIEHDDEENEEGTDYENGGLEEEQDDETILSCALRYYESASVGTPRKRAGKRYHKGTLSRFYSHPTQQDVDTATTTTTAASINAASATTLPSASATTISSSSTSSSSRLHQSHNSTKQQQRPSLHQLSPSSPASSTAVPPASTSTAAKTTALVKSPATDSTSGTGSTPTEAATITTSSLITATTTAAATTTTTTTATSAAPATTTTTTAAPTSTTTTTTPTTVTATTATPTRSSVAALEAMDEARARRNQKRKDKQAFIERLATRQAEVLSEHAGSGGGGGGLAWDEDDHKGDSESGDVWAAITQEFQQQGLQEFDDEDEDDEDDEEDATNDEASAAAPARIRTIRTSSAATTLIVPTSLAVIPVSPRLTVSDNELEPLVYKMELNALNEYAALTTALSTSSSSVIHRTSYGAWSEADTHKTVVRGPTYYADKLKVPTCMPAFKLLHLDVFQAKQKLLHLATLPNTFTHSLISSLASSPSSSSLFPSLPSLHPLPLRNHPLFPLIIFNFMFPSSTTPNSTTHMVFYWQRHVRTANMMMLRRAFLAHTTNNTDIDNTSNPSTLALGVHTTTAGEASNSDNSSLDTSRTAAFDKLLSALLKGDDEYRSGRLKLVTTLADGPWLLKKTVGYVPVIIGRRLKANYFYNRSANYFEIDVDIASNTTYNVLIGIVMKASLSVIVDTSLILQGESADELPESVLGSGSLIRADLSKIPTVDVVAAPPATSERTVATTTTTAATAVITAAAVSSPTA